MSTFDTRISVTKALCIILMVVGHTGCPQFINDIFGLIRMPCFFLCVRFPVERKILRQHEIIF